MNTEEKILESALKIFVEQGFSASTSSITRDAQVSTGILFHYFPKKNDLILTLYSKILSEYFLGTKKLRAGIDEKDPIKYTAIHKDAFWGVVFWSLENWQKYQYLQLFEGSVIADQHKLEENPDLQATNELTLEVLQLGIQQGIFKNLPTTFLIKNMYAVTNSIIEYLHDHPELSNNAEFLDHAWSIYWGTAANG